MPRIRIFPPVIEVYPNDRQLFTAEATPTPPLWAGVVDALTQADSSLIIGGAASSMSAGSGHRLFSGIGVIEFTINDLFRPSSTGLFNLTGFINDVAGFQYIFTLEIAPTTVRGLAEGGSVIYFETYSTVSGDIYRLELNAGFRLYRKSAADADFVLKHSRVGLPTQVIYPMSYAVSLIEPVITDPATIPPPHLIGDWRLAPVVTFTTPSHGSLTMTGPSTATEYFGGTVPGKYPLQGWVNSAADANAMVQRAVAIIDIPALQILGSADVRADPGQKLRFKTNYDRAQTALIAWSVISGDGSFTQGEYVAGSLARTSVVRATASVNSQVADIKVTVPPLITNANGHKAAKVSEQIDFDTNIALIPYFVGVGTKAEGTGAVTPGLPLDLQLSDIMLLFVETANEAVSTPSGWAIVADSPQGTGTGGGAAATRLSVFWKRATATEVAPAVADPGDHAIAQILAFRGCIDTGNPWDVTSGDVAAAATTAVSIPGDTTTVANCLVVLALAQATDTATAQASGYTNADLANLTERTDISSVSGNGGGFAVVTGEKAAIGAYGATTATLATSSVQGRISIALKPALITWSATVGSINSTSGVWIAPSLSGQTGIIKATNGTTSALIEVPILETFPITRTATPVEGERRKKVLISEAEDGTELTRVKNKDGKSREYYSVRITLLDKTDFNTILAFWEEFHPAKPFIWEDAPQGIRIMAKFDSDMPWRETGSGRFEVAFRVKSVVM
jgi:hypothetical protein